MYMLWNTFKAIIKPKVGMATLEIGTGGGDL